MTVLHSTFIRLAKSISPIVQLDSPAISILPMQYLPILLLKFIRRFYKRQRLASICALLIGALFAAGVLVFLSAAAKQITYLIGYLSLAAAAFLLLFSYLNRRQGLGVDVARGWILRGGWDSHVLLIFFSLTLVLFLGIVAAFSYFLTIFLFSAFKGGM